MPRLRAAAGGRGAALLAVLFAVAARPCQAADHQHEHGDVLLGRQRNPGAATVTTGAELLQALANRTGDIALAGMPRSGCIGLSGDSCKRSSSALLSRSLARYRRRRLQRGRLGTTASVLQQQRAPPTNIVGIACPVLAQFSACLQQTLLSVHWTGSGMSSP